MTVDVNRVREEAREIGRALAELESKNRPARVNRPLVKALGESGLLARLFPRELGGSAQDRSGYASLLCAMREGLAAESTEASMVMAVQAGASSPLIQSGNDELIRRWIPGIAAGDVVPAFALTEPDHGSDAGQLECRAEPEGDGWLLHGEKLWITNAPGADIYTIFARTGTDPGSRGVSAFLVPAGAQGLSGEAVDLVKAHSVGRLLLDGVRVERDQMLGDPNRGFRSAMVTLDAARSAVGAAALGAGQAALEMSVKHLQSRRAFGGRLGDQQGIAHPVADCAADLEASRLLIYESARAFDEGRSNVSHLSAMAKLAACKAAYAMVDQAIQVHGTIALETSHRLVPLYHETRACLFEDGTTEITREVIMRNLIGRAPASNEGTSTRETS